MFFVAEAEIIVLFMYFMYSCTLVIVNCKFRKCKFGRNCKLKFVKCKFVCNKSQNNQTSDLTFKRFFVFYLKNLKDVFKIFFYIPGSGSGSELA